MAGPFLTVRQVADEAGVTDRTVRRWISEEGIATFQRGRDRRILIDRADIDRHIAPRLMPRGARRETVEANAQ